MSVYLYTRNPPFRDSVPHSISVVGMTGEDLLGPIELLEQHAADEQMRPCHWSERQDRMGAVEDGGVEPIGAADGKGELRRPFVTPSGDTLGQHAARPTAAALVKSNKRNPRWQCAEDQLGLACFQHDRVERALFLELDDDRGRDDPAGIERLEFPQGTMTQLADREETKTDRPCPGLLPNRFAVGQGFTPHLFEIVVGADLGPEQMHDHIAGVDQHPIRICLPFDRDPDTAGKGLFETFGQGQHLPGRAAARDDHVVGDCRLAGQVDRNDVFGLTVFEGV
jgi:hypothetical protein